MSAKTWLLKLAADAVIAAVTSAAAPVGGALGERLAKRIRPTPPPKPRGRK